MSLADLSSLGTLVSGIAVLASLLYLNVQVRQSTKHARAAISHGFATRTIDFNYRMTDEKLAALVVKGRNASEAFDEVEAAQFFAYCRATFWNIADTFVQHRDGLLDDAVFAAFELSQVGMMRSRGMRIAWSLLREVFAPDFVAFMDRIADEATARGPLDFTTVWSSAIAEERAAALKG